MQVLCFLGAVHTVNAKQGDVPWHVSGLSVVSSDSGTQVKLDQFNWGGQAMLKDVAYHCPEAIGLYPVHHCEDGEMAFKYGSSSHRVKLKTRAHWSQNNWSVLLSDVSDIITVALESQSTTATIGLQEMPLSEVMTLANLTLGSGPQPEVLMTGTVLYERVSGQLKTAMPVTFSGLSYEYSDDMVLAELAGQWSADWAIDSGDLSFSVQIDSGEMLFDQLYVDFSSFPISLKGQLILQDGGWYATNVVVENQQSMQLVVDIQVNSDFEWRQPQVALSVFDSHHFNQQITNSVLGIYGFGGSQMSGQFAISVGSDSTPFDHWTLRFDDYYFLNERRKIAAESLTGQVHWQAVGQAIDSALSWQTLLLTGLPIGQSQTQFNFSGDQLKLLGLHVFPVFDGAIELQTLQVQKLFSEFIDMDIEAKVLPISLRLITEKMGWPPMSGSISGNIPGMVKRNSVIEFLGALQLQVFGGDMQVDNLSMERLFGVAPVIAGDVTFSGFDLSVLTETFGFGLITGRLHGAVRDLRVTNWKTDRLDAQVYTVKTKGVKQVISQRAIENISSLGGIKGAISNTFLRFFDDFRYNKIKLSCRLHNSVCLIGGLKNQGNQFVIVEGGGIPKINIVGYVRAINWEEFMSRLLNANYN